MFLLKGFANKMDWINRVFEKGRRDELASRGDDLQKFSSSLSEIEQLNSGAIV